MTGKDSDRAWLKAAMEKKNTSLAEFYVTELRLLDELCMNWLKCLGISLLAVYGAHLFSSVASGVKYSVVL